MNDQPILYAEDEENDILFMERAFHFAGVANPLVTVPNGQLAVEYLASLRDQDRALFPCLVLLDLNLPLKSGLEVLKWIREQPALANLPVIVVSGSNLQSDKARAKELGARDYFVKDADWEPLVNGLSLRIAELTSEVV